MINRLMELSEKAIGLVDCRYIRPQFSLLKQDERLIGLKGSRGVGKTTLLLQFAKNELANKNKLYISLDNPYFTNISFFEFVDGFVKNGGEYLLVDEVHHYNNWSLILKNIFDNFKDLCIIYTGSSLLHLNKGKGDLSRRSVLFTLPGLSLREYIFLNNNIHFQSFKLEEIIANHIEISKIIVSKLRPIQKYNEYLQTGYYPFFIENRQNYLFKLAETVNQILEADLPFVANISYSNINKLKQFLQLTSERAPFKPNFEKLSGQIGISKNTLKDYMFYLSEAMLIYLLKKDKKGDSVLAKPEKIYMQNPNLMFALVNENSNTGNLRESFFINQLSVKHKINYSEKGDVLVDNKYLFEIGGKNKTYKQIAGIDNSFIAADDIEIGYKNTIPLWLFGFLY
jgi:uncharacterized protein